MWIYQNYYSYQKEQASKCPVFLEDFFGGNPEVSDRGIQGETESHSHGGEKASPVVINGWQIGIQQRALAEKQALFCKYNT